jgi:hypothetical protein
MRTLILAALLITTVPTGKASAQELPAGYWDLDQATEILDKTRNVMLDPDLSALTEAERSAAAKLIEAGVIFNRLYQDSMHPEALASLKTLRALDQGEERTQALLDLYYLFKGPVATTLNNERLPFLPVAAEEPGKNMYPQGMTRELLDPLLETQPGLAADLLAVRSVVRESTGENLAHDLGMLDQFPVLDGLHPGLRSQLTSYSEAVESGAEAPAWYALP